MCLLHAGISSGNHFAFMNQPVAMGKNWLQFAKSLEPLLEQENDGGIALAELRAIMDGYSALSDEVMNRMWARKLGLQLWDQVHHPWGWRATQRSALRSLGRIG